LKLKHDKLLSHFAFNVHMRRYSWVRVLSFLAGLPDLGDGALSAARYNDVVRPDISLELPMIPIPNSRAFYQQH
jgi:hypothetical protein